ncbi:unnamed protein product, partial [Staurois parvus]
ITHLRLVITGNHRQGGGLHCLPAATLPVSLGTLLGMAEHSHPDQSALQTKTLTQHTVKQHTVNPLIIADVNPFLSSVISTVSVLFISTDHCIHFTGDVSDSHFPPVSECPPQSHSPAISR